VAEPFLRSGQLVRVLEDWSPSIEGLFLYYPATGRSARCALHRYDPYHRRLGNGPRLGRDLFTAE